MHTSTYKTACQTIEVDETHPFGAKTEFKVDGEKLKPGGEDRSNG